MNRMLSEIAQEILLSFPGSALGAMLPDEHERMLNFLIKELGIVWDEAFDQGYEQGQTDSQINRQLDSGFLGPR